MSSGKPGIIYDSRINTRLRGETYRKFLMVANNRGVKCGYLFRYIVEEWLEEHYTEEIEDEASV